MAAQAELNILVRGTNETRAVLEQVRGDVARVGQTQQQVAGQSTAAVQQTGQAVRVAAVEWRKFSNPAVVEAWRRQQEGVRTQFIQQAQAQQTAAVAARTQGIAQASLGTESSRLAVQVALLQDRFLGLQQQYRLGQIGAVEYAAGLRTLRTDMGALAGSTQLGAEGQVLLARTGQQVQAQLLRTSAMAQRMAGGMSRAAFGVQALSMSMASGRMSASGLAAALMTMSIGAPVIMGVVAGISSIAVVYALLARRAKEAREEQEKTAAAMRRDIEAMGIARTVSDEDRLQRLEARIARDRARLAAQPSAVALPARLAFGDVATLAANERAIAQAERLNESTAARRKPLEDAIRLAEHELGRSRENLRINEATEGVSRGRLAVQADLSKELGRQKILFEQITIAEQKAREVAESFGRLVKTPREKIVVRDIAEAQAEAARKAREVAEGTGVLGAGAQEFEDAWRSALGRTENAMVGFFESGISGFRGFAEQILMIMRRMMAEILASEVMRALFQRAPRRSSVPDVAAPIVGDIISDLIRGLPRLHGGLAPDEFPAVLERGESVLPRGVEWQEIVRALAGRPVAREVAPSLGSDILPLRRFHRGLAADEFPAVLQRGETVLPKLFAQPKIVPGARELATPARSDMLSGPLSAPSRLRGGLGDAFSTQEPGGRAAEQRDRVFDLIRSLPQLHRGLAPDEFPAILQRGETVLPRGATTTVVQQRITFAPVLLDGASGEAWLRAQKGTIMQIVAEGARRSRGFARELRR